MQVRCEYKYSKPYGDANHMWTLTGRHGGLHLHIADLGERTDGIERFSGGLEVHYRAPPSYMENHAPNEKCWLIGGACWHDGTSLYVSEFCIPFWLSAPTDHDRMFRFLEKEYAERFAKEDES